MIKRTSLAEQAGIEIRQALLRGDYGTRFPSERTLGLSLGISRPTVRAALAMLQKEQLLTMNSRRRRSVDKSSPQKAAGHTLSVRLLHNNLPSSFLSEHLQMLEYLAENLTSPAFSFRLEASPACFSGNPNSALERLISSNNVDLWILYLSSHPMQSWFQRNRIPAVVLGSRFSDISLPAADEDFRAVCRHATGLFISRGHKRIGLIVPKPLRAGDVASREGFMEAFVVSQKKDLAAPLVIEHEGAPETITRTIQGLMKLSHKPTALLVSSTPLYITVHTYLAHLGYRIPEDISLICRNYDPLFHYIIPRPSYYSRNEEYSHRRMLKLITDTLAGKNPKSIFFRSNFVAGQSLSDVKNT